MTSQTQKTIVPKFDIHTTSLTTSNACGKNSCILKSLCIENSHRFFWRLSIFASCGVFGAPQLMPSAVPLWRIARWKVPSA